MSKAELSMNLNKLLENHFGTWHGTRLYQPDWSYDSHAVATTIHSITNRVAMHIMINAWWQPLAFEIPYLADGTAYSWRRWLDTNLAPPDDILPWESAPAVSDKTYWVEHHSIVVLVSDLKIS